MRNALVFGWLLLALLTARAEAQQATIVPQVRTKPAADGKISAIELAPHFVSVIRVPEAVNSVVVGDPALFQVCRERISTGCLAGRGRRACLGVKLPLTSSPKCSVAMLEF